MTTPEALEHRIAKLKKMLKEHTTTDSKDQLVHIRRLRKRLKRAQRKLRNLTRTQGSETT